MFSLRQNEQFAQTSEAPLAGVLNEQRFRALIENSTDAIALVDAQGTITYGSPATTRITGYSLDEFVGRNAFEFIHPGDLESSSGLFAALLQKPQAVVPGQYRFRHHSGEWRWMESIGTNLLDEPSVQAIVVNYRDIDERKREEDRRTFLAKASETLATSLDYEVTLERVAQLAVPHVADWCIVYLVADDGALKQVALAHVDPEKVKWLREFQRRYAPNANSGVAQVVRTGKAQFVADITDQMLVAALPDPDVLRILRALDLQSSMTAPLSVHGRTLGAITFVSTRAGQRYGAADLTLAEELARRAAIAVENAQLYREAQRLNEQLEQRVMERTAQLEATNRGLEREIAERERTEAALRASEEKFAKAFAASPAGITLSRLRDGTIVDTNEVYLRMLGYGREEVVAHTTLELGIVSAEDRERITQSMLEQGRVRDLEIGVRTKSGEMIEVLSSLEPIELDGEPSILAIIYDITARKRAEAAVQQLNADLARQSAKLEAANKELEAFSYSVSHDLRAPLRHIAGYVELLQKDAARLDEKPLRYLNTIADAAKRMGDLIDDLLAFSRVGRSALHQSHFSMSQVVHEVIQEQADDVRDRTIAWQIDDLPSVYADRALVRQVWANLVGNALKYTGLRETAEIKIGCDAHDDECVFFIADNGVGFDMRYVDKLFGVFQRLHSAAEFDGTGIGLANVRRIVNRHGGKAWAQGALDAGATFYFSLPRAAGD